MDSALSELRLAFLKRLTEGVDNPQASAQWVILKNIYP